MHYRCPKYTFKCRYGACINKLSKCNGVNNCIDGSDEDQCSKKPILKPKPPTVIASNTQYNTQSTTQSNEKYLLNF